MFCTACFQKLARRLEARCRKVPAWAILAAVLVLAELCSCKTDVVAVLIVWLYSSFVV